MESYTDWPIQRLSERYNALQSHLEQPYLSDERKAQISREMFHIAFEADSQGEVLETSQLELPYDGIIAP